MPVVPKDVTHTQLALDPVNARLRLHANQLCLLTCSHYRSHEVLEDVFLPIITGKLAALGFPLWRCGYGILLPVIEYQANTIVSYCNHLSEPCQENNLPKNRQVQVISIVKRGSSTS